MSFDNDGLRRRRWSSFERGGGGSIEDFAVRIESRAMAWTIPTRFDGIPGDNAPKLRADGRAAMQSP